MNDGMKHRHVFRATVVFLVLSWVFMQWGYPLFAAWIAAPDWFSLRLGLPSGGEEVPLFMGLAVLGCYCYVSYDQERLEAFKAPILRFLRQPGRRRSAVLVALPMLGTIWMLAGALSGQPEPRANPLRHPTPPEVFSRMTNPFRSPTEEMLTTFQQSVASGEISAEDTTEEVVERYARMLTAGRADRELREEAFLRRCIEEGRVLYQINCRPCHGTKAMGLGPQAKAQRRAVAEFTGVETIATLVEGAVFWRVKTGGIGLPGEGAPWESAMPRWETDLSDEQIWKIIMAEFDTAGIAPREPEEIK